MNINYLNDVASLAIQDCAFPGGVLLSGTSKSQPDLMFNFGSHTDNQNSPKVEINHYFDLASLTKVVATTPCIMELISQNELALNDKINKFLPKDWFFKNPLKSDIEIVDLLAHCSGLSACVDNKVILDPKLSFEDRWNIIKNMPLIYTRRLNTVYSDIGFIILGRVIELIASVALDKFAKEHIFIPLGMSSTTYNPTYPNEMVVPTEFTSEGNLLSGVVHDECARSIGGVSGHAGLFSEAQDLAKYARVWLDSQKYNLAWANPELIHQFRQKANLVNLSTRALGWNTVSISDKVYSINDQFSAGNYIESSGFGHTGFVGNSIWLSPLYDRYMILLTNQIYPKRDEVDSKVKQYWRNKLTNVAWELLGYTKTNNLPPISK